MIATYRLSDKLPSFEFFNWLVMVQADGASKICFDTSKPKIKNKKTSLSDIQRRVSSILEPGPALAGLDYCMGSIASQLDATPSALKPWYESGRRFKRLRSVKPPFSEQYTVTIRDNSAGARLRDSNRQVWEKFATEIGALVIDDHYHCPIHLHDRMALYAGAKMNFGVCNGPIHILSLTEYPVAMFVNSQSARNSQTRWGMMPDTKYPWMLPNQHMVWKDDNDVGTLLRCFEKLKLP